MTLSDVLPDRPLTYREVSKLDNSEAFDGALPLVERGLPPRIVCLLVFVGEEQINLAWHSGREEWAVIERKPRQDHD